MYSNTNFQILAYAVEAIVGCGFPELFQRALVEPLGLNETTYALPEDESNGVIPESNIPRFPGWDLQLGESGPLSSLLAIESIDRANSEFREGGFYSSANDLSQVGRSILNSSLLDRNVTRASLKPVSQTASVGRGRLPGTQIKPSSSMWLTCTRWPRISEAIVDFLC